MASKVEEGQVQRLSAIREDNPYLFWRIVAIRNMIEHRGFTVKDDIAPTIGRSGENIYAILRGSSYRFSYDDPNAPRNNTSHLETIHRTLDLIEDAISSLSEARGGVYGSCGCTQGAINLLKNYLSTPLDARRAFGERADYDTD